jgi:hypothetical protein
LNFAVRIQNEPKTGTAYQFAVGVWPDSIGEGVVISDVAFCFLEPHLRRVYPDLHPMARYGTAVIPNRICVDLAGTLRRQALRLRRLRYSIPLQRLRGSPPPRTAHGTLAFPAYALCYDEDQIAHAFARNPRRYFDLARLFDGLADWFERTAATGETISLLGI